MKNNAKRIMIGVVAVTVGSAALGDSFWTRLAASWSKRLFYKTSDGFVDATTRTIVANANVPEAREEYELISDTGYYGDRVRGTYGGMRLPDQYRQMWLDPSTRQPNFRTTVDGVLVDTFPFYYEKHRRNYSCRDGVQPPRYDYYITAECDIWLQNRVVKVDFANAFFSHPVFWDIGLGTLPKTCTESHERAHFHQFGTETLMRGGYKAVRPQANDVDYMDTLVIYDEK